MLADTHAHIHFDEYAQRLDEVFAAATKNSVELIICVGVDEADSAKAVELAQNYDQAFATVGLHPHEAGRLQALKALPELAASPKVVAIGECGLDFYRNLSSKNDQVKAFRFQIELALERSLPMVWHVR